MAKQSKEKQLTVKDETMTAITVSLSIIGKPMTQIAKMLGIHRDTVKKYLERKEAKELVEPFKTFIVMAGGRAIEVLLEDLNYNGKDTQRLQTRNRTALKLLQAPGVLPKESRGDIYIGQQNILEPRFMKLLDKVLGLPKVSHDSQDEDKG